MESFNIVVCERVRVEPLPSISRFSYVNAFSSIDLSQLRRDGRFEFGVNCNSDDTFPASAEILIRVLLVGAQRHTQVSQHRAKLIGEDNYILATGTLGQSLFMKRGVYRIELYYRVGSRKKWPRSPNAVWIFEVTNRSSDESTNAA